MDGAGAVQAEFVHAELCSEGEDVLGTIYLELRVATQHGSRATGLCKALGDQGVGAAGEGEAGGRKGGRKRAGGKKMVKIAAASTWPQTRAAADVPACSRRASMQQTRARVYLPIHLPRRSTMHLLTAA